MQRIDEAVLRCVGTAWRNGIVTFGREVWQPCDATRTAAFLTRIGASATRTAASATRIGASATRTGAFEARSCARAFGSL